MTMWLQWSLLFVNPFVIVICVPLQDLHISNPNEENKEPDEPVVKRTFVIGTTEDILPPTMPVTDDIMLTFSQTDTANITRIADDVISDVFILETPDDTSPTIEDEPPEEQNKPNMFESDIRLSPEQKIVLETLLEDINATDGDMTRMEKRKGIGNLANRWPKAVVPYIIDSSITNPAGIEKAIRHWEYHTCIRFREMTDELAEEIEHTDHVVFEKGDGFWSYVGRVGTGAQTVCIGDESRVGSIAHEIGHAVGFWHEQARPDRDDYIIIDLENVMPGYESAFKTYDWEQVLTHDIPYDVGSLMHYGAYYFSWNREPTIIARNPEDQDRLGNRVTLSKYDIKLANIMYECPDALHCTNQHKWCDRWTARGFCETGKYVGYMLGKCTKSCDVCHVCEDKNDRCINWVKRGLCDSDKYGGYMRSNCKRACGFCPVLDNIP